MARLARESLSGRTLVALVPHMDAGDRTAWTRDQDERPLSDLGRQQADAIAEALAEEYEITALFASTALRAKQTLEPLAERLGLPVQIEPLLSEKRIREDAAAMAQRGVRALSAIREAIADGIAVAASHGDIIPATGKALGASDVLARRGQWYEITTDGGDTSVTLREAANFPL